MNEERSVFMKKKTTIIVMILLLALSMIMSGCRGNNNDVNDNTPGTNNSINDNNDTRRGDFGEDLNRTGTISEMMWMIFSTVMRTTTMIPALTTGIIIKSTVQHKSIESLNC